MVTIRKHVARLTRGTFPVREGFLEYIVPSLPQSPYRGHRHGKPPPCLDVDLKEWPDSSRVPIVMHPEGSGNLFPVYTKRAWLYKDDAYVVDDLDLTSEDVLALIHEAENKRRVRLEKAHAVAAMAEALTEPKRRRPIPQDVRILVWKRDGGRCVDCDSQENLEFDHIIPVAMGGANTDRNLQLLCQDCNRRKGASLG